MILLILSLLLVCSSVIVSAEVDISENEVIVVLNGIAKKMSKMEALKTLEKYNFSNKDTLENKNTIIQPYYTTYWNRYTPMISRYEFDYSQTKAVTPWTKANSDGDTISHGSSVTVNSTTSVNLTSSELSIISLKLGFNYSKSSSSNASFGQTFKLSKGQTARVIFTPAVIYTYGALDQLKQADWENKPSVVSTKYVSARLLQKVGKFADGLYEIEIR